MCSGAEAQIQVVPEGIESVSGSSETMGCTSPLEDSGGVTVCRSQSYLLMVALQILTQVPLTGHLI